MSFQSQILYFMMKNRHLLQLRLQPEVWDEKTSIPAFRQMCEDANRKMADKLPAGLKVDCVKKGETKNNEKIDSKAGLKKGTSNGPLRGREAGTRRKWTVGRRWAFNGSGRVNPNRRRDRCG
jgi:hypothetical protein